MILFAANKPGMKKVLLIRFSSIGDIVLTTPVIRCLKQQTGAELHFLTKQAYLPLLEANPYLDKIFTIEKKTAEVLPGLKKEGYDLIIDLHKNLRSRQVRTALRAQVFSFKKLNFEKWLLVNFKINKLPELHVVDRYFASVAPLGVKDDGLGLDYFFPKGLMPNTPPKGVLWTIPFLAFAIGAAHRTKRLPREKTIEICKRIKQPILLLGGKNEAAEGETIAQKSGKHVTNCCGKLTLHESAKVIELAQRVIAHDTGMMHIAAAFQKEILSVWGSTVPAFGMTPYYGRQPDKNTTFEVQGLSCRPCSKIGFAGCPKGHFRCMEEQDVEAIVRRAKGQLP